MNIFVDPWILDIPNGRISDHPLDNENVKVSLIKQGIKMVETEMP